MKRPWADRADQLEAKEGYWCDYAAFLEWFGKQESKLYSPGDIIQVLIDNDTIDTINLYCIFCDAFDAIKLGEEDL